MTSSLIRASLDRPRIANRMLESNMADALQQIDDVATRADAELKAVKNAAELEQFRIKYLGAKGEIKALMKLLGQVPREQKPAMGQKVNAVQDQVNAAFEARKTEFS